MHNLRWMKSGGVLTLLILAVEAGAQNAAPFTIRNPPDGSTVREKVEVRIPLASIPEGAFIGFSIDGKFRVALAPTDEQRTKAKPGDMFTYVWDTKASFKQGNAPAVLPPSDGAHTISATLYTPVKEASKIAQVSSVRVTVANKIVADPGPLTLRYRYKDGTQRTYGRVGDTVILAGLSQGRGGTGEQELIGQKSELLLSVEDLYRSGNAIVRNKLTKLQVRSSSGQQNFRSEDLPGSLYQEVDPLGNVKYQNNKVDMDSFAMQGLPISSTLDLPQLPLQPVKVGDSWETRNVVVDVPGVLPNEMPKVTVKSTLVGLEWEGLYPTAKIHQEFKGASPRKLLNVGDIPIENATLDFKRDIYFAYDFGTLVKVDRTLEISGKTTAMIDPNAGGAPGMGGGGMAPNPGAFGGGMGMGAPMPGMMGSGGGRGGRPGGGGRSGGGARGGKDDDSGAGIGLPGGFGRGGSSGGGGRGGSSGGGARGGIPAPGMGGMMGGLPGGGQFGGGGGAFGAPAATQQITLKSTTITELRRPEPAKTKVASK